MGVGAVFAEFVNLLDAARSTCVSVSTGFNYRHRRAPNPFIVYPYRSPMEAANLVVDFSHQLLRFPWSSYISVEEHGFKLLCRSCISYQTSNTTCLNTVDNLNRCYERPGSVKHSCHARFENWETKSNAESAEHIGRKSPSITLALSPVAYLAIDGEYQFTF
jgi:hypothetical protein